MGSTLVEGPVIFFLCFVIAHADIRMLFIQGRGGSMAAHLHILMDEGTTKKHLEIEVACSAGVFWAQECTFSY